MFEISTTKYAKKKVSKLLKNNPSLIKVIDKAFNKLKNNPFDFSLHTHKVNSKNFELKFSSRINGDLRFIWDFNENKLNILDLFDIREHSGSSGVY